MKGENKMTNREWLKSLSNKELEEWLCDDRFRRVKHGEWIDEEVDCGGIYGGIATQVIYCCSECGEQWEYKTNFCQNCGADMRENRD